MGNCNYRNTIFKARPISLHDLAGKYNHNFFVSFNRLIIVAEQHVDRSPIPGDIVGGGGEGGSDQ